MRLARRFVSPAPAREPRAARVRVTRARALGSGLLGALAGLALAGAIVAGAPVVGGAPSPQVSAAPPNGAGGGRLDPDEEPASVAAVLAPAIEAGVVAAARRPEAARP